jgi:hypothetical protein
VGATLTVIEPSLTVNTNQGLLFNEFWTAYPTCKRKGGKSKCLSIWNKKNFDSVADQILTHLNYMRDDFTKDAGAFCPAPEAYLNKQGWDGAELGKSSSDEQQVYF